MSVKVGQVYVAADGGAYGHVVLDVTTYADVGDVVVRPFNRNGWAGEPNRIDLFKLTQVRYKLYPGKDKRAQTFAQETPDV